MRPDISRRIRTGLWHTVLAGAVLLMVFPVLWATLSSFRPANSIFEPWPFAGGLTLEHYRSVFANWHVALLVGNTTAMAAGVTVGQVIVAILAAFALVYLPVRGRRVILALTAVSLAVPPQAIIIPQFLMATRLGWQNTDAGLIVPQLASSGLAILLLVQHTRDIPAELVEAARMDGARHVQVLRHVILPALAPAIAAVGILTFITTWNEYLWPLLIAPRSEDTTVQIGLQQFVTAEGNDYGGLLAAATLTSLPIVVVYLIASRRITDAFLHAGLR